MGNKKVFSLIIITGILLLLSLLPQSPFYDMNWALFSFIMIGLFLIFFFWRFEKSPVSSKEVALIATMAALASVSRIPFSAVVSLQPVTFLVMLSGYVFGARTGFMVGALTALVSNFFLGQGPWTPWQMFCWGLCGAVTSFFGRKNRDFHLFSFTLLGVAWAFLFGWIMNFWHWVAFIYPLNWRTFLGTYAASLPFDVIHAVGNVIFTLVFGKSFYHILIRFRKRIIVTAAKTKN